MAPSIRVIIVNYNSGETIAACIQSVLAAGERTEIMVYDNASSDGGAALVQSLFSKHGNIEVIQGAENIGFSRAVNVAVKSPQSCPGRAGDSEPAWRSAKGDSAAFPGPLEIIPDVQWAVAPGSQDSCLQRSGNVPNRAARQQYSSGGSQWRLYAGAAQAVRECGVYG
jgi:hypothetical protein